MSKWSEQFRGRMERRLNNGQEKAPDEQNQDGQAGESDEASDHSDTDDFQSDAGTMDEAETPMPWRPNTSVLENPEQFGYKVFTRANDEEVIADELSTPDELDRLRSFLDKELKTLSSAEPTARA